MTNYIGQLEPFVSGSNFESYEDRVRQFLKANKVTDDDMKTSVFISIMGQDNYDILKSLMIPDLPSSKSFEDIMKVLKKHHDPKKNKRAERFKFNKTMQQSGETISEFIVRLKSLAQTCLFGELHKPLKVCDKSVKDSDVVIDNVNIVSNYKTLMLDDALSDRFIVGLSNNKIQQHLLNKDDLTFEEYCQIALNMEMSEKESHEIQPKAFVNKVQSSNARGHSKSVEHRSRSKSKGRDVNSKSTSTNRSNVKECRRCGRLHNPNTCPAANWKCYVCQKTGHTSVMCYNKESSNSGKSMSQNKQKPNYHPYIRSFAVDKNLEEDFSRINVVNRDKFRSERFVDHEPLEIELNVENQKVSMEVDSGAAATVMCEQEYRERFGNAKLSEVSNKFKVLTGANIKTLGQMEVGVWFNGVLNLLSLVIVATDGYVRALLGRPWLDVLQPNWRNLLISRESKKINSVSTKTNPNFLKTLKRKFPNAFKKNKLPIKGFKADLVLKEGSVPIFHCPYSVPFKLRERFEKQLEMEVADSVLEPVKFSRWASPVVLVPKTDGGLRMCMDCKVTINKCIETEHYPTPLIDEIFANLANCKYFCKIDLKGAYLQLEVSEESRELLTINTLRGLYRYKRMALGIKNGPSIFQSVMDQILSRLDRVFCYQDDILIGGYTLEDCQEKLFEVIQRLENHNVQINVEKSEFLVQSVKYLGHVVSCHGISPNSDKTKAIVEAPVPENVSQLKAYLGLINYYNKFLPNLSAELKDLYQLLRKGVKFSWSNKCQAAFEKSKSMILDNNLLEMFDPNKPIILATDASPYGVGAVLSHIVNGIEKPVMFISSSLSPAEKNYSQLHREALAIIFALKKLHNYLYGQKFVICTDNQALKEILSPGKNTPAVAAARLQRWAVILSMYDYEIRYKKGSEMGNADGLSRLPLKEETKIQSFRISYFDSENSPLKFEEIQRHTESDEDLVAVRRYLMFGWPLNGVVSETLKPYFNKRNSLAIENNCVFYGSRVVVPESLKKNVLKVLHENHLGIVRMKMVARSYAWWPLIDKDIESFCAKCFVCQQTQKVKKEVVNTSWATTSYPFERVHIDFFDFQGKKFFLLVDVFSKLVHIEWMNINSTAEKVISVLQNFFTVFGIPTQVVSDNGPPFGSKKLEDFFNDLGIKFTNSPPYHPQSNGSAEKYVSTVKTVFKKFVLGAESSLSLQQKINKFLIHQRSTPSTVTKRAPIDLIFKYKPKTVLDLINEKVKVKIDSSVENEVKNVNINNNKTKVQTKSLKSDFNVGENVMYRNHLKYSVKWLPARVVEVISAHTYLINVYNNIRYVHENQIRKSTLEDKYHPEVRNFPQLSHKDFVMREKIDTPMCSPKSESSTSSPKFSTPMSSPKFETPKSTRSTKVQSPKSDKQNSKRVQFQLPTNSTRGRSQSLSEESILRRSSRTKTKPVRYGFSESEKN